jgi:hypothetical protein
VFEIISRIARHAQAFHDSPRAFVFGNRHRDDLVEPQATESDGHHRSRGFGGVATPPPIHGQPPTNFHAWREVHVE